MTAGLVLIGIALFIFVFKLYVSYTSHGGAQGMVPVLDGAIYPPPIATFGLSLWFKAAHINLWGGWLPYVLIWFVITALAAKAIIAIGNLGEKRGI